MPWYRSKWLRNTYSLRAYLIAFGIALLVPVTIVAWLLLAHAASLERGQYESRLIQIADDLAEDVEREIDRRLILLRALAAFPALVEEDWSTFHDQAKAAVGDTAYVILLDTSGRQLVNTFVPYGAAPARTGDPETIRRIIEAREPVISDLFVSLVTKRPVYNVSIPVFRNSELRYILSLGELVDSLLQVLKGQRLSAEWITTIQDRNGVLMARSKAHERFIGSTHPEFQTDKKVTERSIRHAKSLEGESVLRVVVRCKLSNWLVTANLPVALANAPLRRSQWQWSMMTLGALAFGAVLASLVASALVRPMAAAAKAAVALGHDQPIKPVRSAVTEINTIAAAQEFASTELSERTKHQTLLLRELSHRVKNVLAVVQSLVIRTLSDERSIADAREVVIDRLHALGRAHDTLMHSDWKGAPLREIINSELEPFAARVACDGPDVIIAGNMVQTFVLLLHELATNAAKHGSLSAEHGTVSIAWTVTCHGNVAHFGFRWQERDGPSVKPPTRIGFGSTILKSTVPSEVQPHLAYESEGFVYEFETALSAVGKIVQ
jgi:two-component sensor histidine kinase